MGGERVVWMYVKDVTAFLGGWSSWRRRGVSEPLLLVLEGLEVLKESEVAFVGEDVQGDRGFWL